MLRYLWQAATALLVVGGLAACEFTVIPFDPVVSGTFTAQNTTSPTPLRSNVAIAPGETLFYRINASSARDLLYGEAVGSNLRVRLLASSGATRGISQSPQYFAWSLGALSVLEAAVEPEARLDPHSIVVNYACLGPCVAIEPTAGSYYLSVENRGGVTTSFDLYAYAFDANDQADRGTSSNDSLLSAVPFAATGFLFGAIEVLGDRDYFHYTGGPSRTIRFTVTNPALGLRLRFSDGTSLSGAPGDQTTSVFGGDRFWVESVLDRAGPSATSRYSIEIF